MKNNLFRLVILVFLNVLVCSALATDYVSSVRSYQDGKNIIITYELSKQTDITVSVSTDGGNTYRTLKSVYGDVGNTIKPGSKKIVWEVLSDYESFSFSQVCFKVETNFYNGHEFVDLGLPSGTLWATCNVGASKPEEYGDYFAWGETKPKSNYSWKTYKWCNGNNNTQIKYCTDSSYGNVDNMNVLELIDDAANIHWGGYWRMPTRDELDELRTYCIWIWTTNNNVKGYKVTSKTNDNSIFMPAAGVRSYSDLLGVGSEGYYWTSSLNTDYVHYSSKKRGDSNVAYNMVLYPESLVWVNFNRFYGLSVRPVFSK